MNENHNHDKALEDAIERLVHGKKASGNELLDTLGTARPKADPTFMANLEDRLMAEFSSNKKEKLIMKRKEIPSKFGRWPLTMAAAVFAILLVGGFALFMQQNQEDEASGIVMNPVTAVVAVQAMIPGTVIEADMVEMRTFTPDTNLDQIMLIDNVDLVIGRSSQTYVSVGEPLLVTHISADVNSAMIPVVIAIQDIPEGTEIGPDRVETIYFPAANAPSGAFNSEEDVVGYFANTDIYAEEIILRRKLVEQPYSPSPAPLDLTATAIVALATFQADTSCIMSDWNMYTVQEGDTLSNLAAEYNVTPRDIVTLNCWSGVNHVVAGDIIRVPAREIDEFALTATAIIGQATAQAQAGCPIPQALVYTVQEGDTIYSIARDHNVAANDIFTANCLGSVADITVGDLIYIPSEIDSFSLTATAIVATATASANIVEEGLIVRNAPEPLGCHNDNARILYPLNGQMIDAPVAIRAIANHDEFGQTRIEISGPSTNEQFVVIASIAQEALVETEIGQFVPAFYEDGEYQLRLNTFTNSNSQVGTCTITIYISNEATNTSEGPLRPVVIAVRDIPLNTVITEDMVMLSYWPDAVAMQFAMENNGEWYLDNLEGVIGKQSTDFIPAFEPISSNLLIRDFDCDAPCAILPSNGVAIALRNSDESIQNLIIGQSVDVIVSFTYLQTSDNTFQVMDGGELTMQRVVSNAQVIWIGGNPPDFWNVEPDAALLRDEKLIVVAVTASDATVLSWVTEAQMPIMVVPAIEGVEPIEIQQSSSEIQNPENFMGMMVWMDASALSFSAGQHVDVVGQFIYLNAEGQFEGMITHRMGVNWIVRDVEAGEGEMAAYALVSLDIDESSLVVGEMIPSVQSILQGDSHILAAWSLVPYSPELGESIQYFSYNNVAEPMPVEASSLSNGHHYVAIPNMQVENLAGGLTVGDTIHVTLEDGQVIEAQLRYIGSAIYAPFTMQPALDEFRAQSPRLMVLEVASAEEANAISGYVGNYQPISIERQP